MGLSGLLHAALIGAALYVAQDRGLIPSLPTSETLTFVELVPPPPVIRTPPLRMPPAVKEELRVLDTPLKVELPAPEPEKLRGPAGIDTPEEYDSTSISFLCLASVESPGS